MRAEATHPLTGIDRALVIGMGASGQASARALVNAGVEVTLVDDDPDHPAAADLRAQGLHVVEGVSAAEVLDPTMQLVVPSPGVPEHAVVLQIAQAAGAEIWSEPELGLRLHPHRLVAVTGTNGKTSTTELITVMLEASGIAAASCGNIGRTVTEAAAQEPQDTLLVGELSSFQLRFVTRLRAEVAVVLNLAVDHLDWHGDLDSYRGAKARIFQTQTATDVAVANADDVETLEMQRQAPGRRASFSATQGVDLGVGREGDDLVWRSATGDRTVVLGLDELPSAAPHHVANVAAACCVALLAGADLDAVRSAARSFTPGRHRLEPVATVSGVNFVDDSKATNIHATAAALRSFTSIVWIAGGLAKGVDLSPLGHHLTSVRAGYFIGSAADELTRICHQHDVPAEAVGELVPAVHAAMAAARPGDTVLLSPACASFDQFEDYIDRGRRFRAAVEGLAQASSGSMQALTPVAGDDDGT